MRGAFWWIDRWRQSSAYMDLSAEERGVYRELLDELWLREGLLPANDRLFERLAGSPEVWARVGKNVIARFELTPEGYRNKTHDEVSRESSKRAERQKRYRNKDHNVTHNVTHNDRGGRDGNEDGNVTASPFTVHRSPDKSKEKSPRVRKTNAPTPAALAIESEKAIEEQRLTENLTAIRESGRDIQTVLDALPRSPSRSAYSASTWLRSGRSGFPTSGPALTAMRMLNDALEAKQRGVKATRKGNGAPAWDRGDDDEAELDSRAIEWIEGHPGATSGVPEDIAGRVSMILFARKPKQAKEAKGEDR